LQIFSWNLRKVLVVMVWEMCKEPFTMALLLVWHFLAGKWKKFFCYFGDLKPPLYYNQGCNRPICLCGL
jgi:hypothetical protein